MQGIISDELLIKIVDNDLTVEELKELLSLYGNVSVTQFNQNSVIVKFMNKDNVVKTLEDFDIGQKICDCWKSLPPHPEILRESDSPIKNLSDDCLASVFSYLPITDRLNAEKVCKSWRKVGKRGWPDVQHFDSTVHCFSKNESFQIFQRCGRFLKHLKVTIQEEYHYLSFIEENCSQLEIINVQLPWHNDHPAEVYHRLSKIFRQSKQLNSLVIMPVFPGSLGKCLPHLSNSIIKIYLRGDLSTHTREPFVVDFSHFTNLQYLKLISFRVGENNVNGFDELKNLTVLSFSLSVVPTALINVIPNFSKLHSLSLEKIGAEVDDDCIIRIARSCRDLTYFKISGIENLTDACLVELAELPKLEVLKLRDQPYFTSDGIASLCNVKKLECLNCEGLNYNDGLVRLIEASCSITYIYTCFTALYPPHLQAANDALKNRQNGIPLEVVIDVNVDIFNEEDFNPKDPASMLNIDVLV